jgi:hypothetical protein
MDKPSVYGLPENPGVPQRQKSLPPISGPLDILTVGLAAIVGFRERTIKEEKVEGADDGRTNEHK